MGCKTCGQKKKRKFQVVNGKVFDSTGRVISDSLEAWNAKSSKKKPQRKSIKKNYKDIINNKPSALTFLDRTNPRTNISKLASSGKSIFIIGRFQGCSSCRYMMRLLDKYSNLFWDINFFAIEKNDVQPNGFVFKKNPTIVFIENGKTVKEIYGIEPQIKSYIEEFQKGDEPKSQEKTSVQSHKVYELKDIPSYSEAYQKLLQKLKQGKKQIQSISTFMDEKKGVLVVTVDFGGK